MMNYIEKNLNNNETVVYKARKSPVLLVKSVLMAIGILALGCIFGSEEGGEGLLVLCILAAVGIVVGKWYMIKQSELTITNRRIVSKDGLIRKR